jgi:hypothetical protein
MLFEFIVFQKSEIMRVKRALDEKAKELERTINNHAEQLNSTKASNDSSTQKNANNKRALDVDTADSETRNEKFSRRDEPTSFQKPPSQTAKQSSFINKDDEMSDDGSGVHECSPIVVTNVPPRSPAQPAATKKAPAQPEKPKKMHIFDNDTESTQNSESSDSDIYNPVTITQKKICFPTSLRLNYSNRALFSLTG